MMLRVMKTGEQGLEDAALNRVVRRISGGDYWMLKHLGLMTEHPCLTIGSPTVATCNAENLRSQLVATFGSVRDAEKILEAERNGHYERERLAAAERDAAKAKAEQDLIDSIPEDARRALESRLAKEYAQSIRNDYIWSGDRREMGE